MTNAPKFTYASLKAKADAARAARQSTVDESTVGLIDVDINGNVIPLKG